MNIRHYFLQELPLRTASRVDRAVMIASFAKLVEGKTALTVREIADFFEAANLARPNSTILAGKLAADKRVSFRRGQARALHTADADYRKIFPELSMPAAESHESSEIVSKIDRNILRSAPFIDEGYFDGLSDMIDLYGALHVLENSIRRLIQSVLERHLGRDWWSIASNESMKRKHEDRLQKEANRKWLPARSALGPLYSIDWSDLITLVRKFEVQFSVFIGEIDFMHRYADLGLLRHVIAHNGFVDDTSEFQRVALALRDWNSQVAPIVSREFPST